MPQIRQDQGGSTESSRRIHTRGPHRHRFSLCFRSRIRRTDQGTIGQSGGPSRGRCITECGIDTTDRIPSRRIGRDTRQGIRGPGGRRRCPRRPRYGTSKDVIDVDGPSRQTRRLRQSRSVRIGNIHRRGRFGRRFGQAGERSSDPGDLAVEGEDTQHRTRRRRTDLFQRRTSGTHIGVGVGGERVRVRRGGVEVRTDSRHDGRRRRRGAHPCASVDVLLEVSEGIGREGTRVHRPTSPVQGEHGDGEGEEGTILLRREREGGGLDGNAGAGRRRGRGCEEVRDGSRRVGREGYNPTVQGTGGDDARAAVVDDYGSGEEDDAASHGERLRPRRSDVERAHGRCGRTTEEFHQRARREFGAGGPGRIVLINV
mmetsp:Transcript_63227/g.186929  ORF Transcript_63227/g.186929 Transcript_63227/m.186929 type:complete len:371 (+) Transcript_63227:1859-2971(+)